MQVVVLMIVEEYFTTSHHFHFFGELKITDTAVHWKVC